jgi:hypothetical protein
MLRELQHRNIVKLADLHLYRRGESDEYRIVSPCMRLKARGDFDRF